MTIKGGTLILGLNNLSHRKFIKHHTLLISPAMDMYHQSSAIQDNFKAKLKY